MRFILILSFCALLFSSCEEQAFYENTVIIPESNWSYSFKPAFKVVAQDTSQNFDLFLNIDHNTSFSFQNLYINITTEFPNSESKEERLSIDLAEQIGKWVGDCNAEKCKTKVYLLENFKFSDPGQYTFTMEQFSRQENLKDINSLQLQIYSKKGSS